ncbi:MerR family transcriptional regulator [Paraclostridium ghonii]|uniref:DNA-binding transcriptional MerR regulator n=1 Tax=Paraclostridium ghonii TaxID=29358 RepID=A0ABU0MXR5_9FIRM|nr:MerR family transcriptional regulator [Paeniclostridium ghonii]MDQ0555635.1 DNA-binding transcriptional MerR regulator [Paeniclostridium ghonii]
MYKIGEFSKLTQISTKTLRYYDEEYILVPSYRDSNNGYRYYNEEDYKKAILILELRNLEFSILEIKDILSICKDKEDILYIFKEKSDMIKNQINELEKTLNKLNDYKRIEIQENKMNEYKIEFKTMPAITVAALRFTGKYSDVGQYFSEIYKIVKNNSNGYPFCLHYDNEYKENADIEVCVPIKKIIKSDKITIRQIPKVEAITTIHNGNYTEINKAYKEIFNYKNTNDINCSIPHREIYRKGPGRVFKGNPKKYVTEIVMPITREE